MEDYKTVFVEVKLKDLKKEGEALTGKAKILEIIRLPFMNETLAKESKLTKTPNYTLDFDTLASDVEKNMSDLKKQGYEIISTSPVGIYGSTEGIIISAKKTA